ncbi:hypothetical protein E9993_01945 [Labilibacter sediminis]|nr:hypothetical protein E9993_01945 [Labilibacter sediminis]
MKNFDYKFLTVLVALAITMLNEVHSQIHVSTVADLQAMSSNPSGGYILDNDIDMQNQSWTSFDFTGTINGGGYSILNLSIQHDGDRGGLFNNITGATISNLGLKNLTVNTPNAWTAGFAGNGSNSTITKCFVTGSITSNGFAGSFIGHVDNSIVSECYSTANVTGRDHVGGIVAHVNGNGATIENCYYNGNVYSTGWQVGGIAGWAEGSTVITKCYVKGTTGSESGFSGGMLGVAPGGQNVSVTKCIAMQTSMTTVNPDIEKTYRIIGDHAGVTFTNNYGFDQMGLTDPHKFFWESAADGKDGADITSSQFKDATFYSTNLNWDFSQIWYMDTDGPVLRWQGDFPTSLINAEVSNIKVFVTQGQIHVVGAEANSLVEIFDITGKRKVSEYIKSSESVYTVKGILIVRVASENGTTVNKVVNL